MSGSFKIFEYRNIPVFVHWTFSLLLLWVVGLGFMNNMALAEIAFGLGIILCLFVCVTLHEFGHALAGLRYGVPTQDIILSPIGGVARMNRIPEKPVQELIIALAGPMVNVIIVIVLLPLYFLLGGERLSMEEALNAYSEFNQPLLALIILNIFLIIFNMIPAFPMDGGRVLRSLLSFKFSRVKATLIAVRIGQFFAVLFAILAFYSNGIFLAVIAVFVFMAAQQEYKSVKVQDGLANALMGEIALKNYKTLAGSDTIGQAIQLAPFNQAPLFVVTNETEQLMGILEKAVLQKLQSEAFTDQSILPYVRSGFLVVNERDNLKNVLARFSEKNVYILVVNEQEVVVGYLDIPFINEYIKSL